MINAGTRAVIVGGSQGLCYAAARHLIEEGCRAIAISGRDEAKREAAARELSQSGARVEFIKANIAAVEDCAHLVEKAARLLGPLNGLFKAAAARDRGGLLAPYSASKAALANITRNARWRRSPRVCFRRALAS